MSFVALTVLCAIAYAGAAVHAVQYELPPSVKTCKKDLDDYSSCLRLATQESWPTFVKGIPELDFPPLDPCYKDLYEITYQEGEARAHAVVRNTNAYGLAKARFLAVRPFMENDVFRLEIDVVIPKLFIEGDYKVDGSFSMLKIGGKGYFNVSMEDVSATWKLSGPVVNDRWEVEHFEMMPEIGQLKVYFSDMFNGNEELNKAALTMANEYWPYVYQRTLPIAAKYWDKYLTDFVNVLFSKVSFASVFP